MSFIHVFVLTILCASGSGQPPGGDIGSELYLGGDVGSDLSSGGDYGSGMYTDGGVYPGRRSRCRWGSAGTCGGYVGARCPYGSYCRRNPFSTAGTCCRYRPSGGGRGRCPRIYRTPTICPYSMAYSYSRGTCYSDYECLYRKLCCFDGCRYVCK